jgi:adhesin transport system outer membrane protein
MKYPVSLFFFLLSIYSINTHAFAETLKQAIETALQTNPRIEAALASQRATEFVLEQSKGRFLPEVDIRLDKGLEKINRPEGIGPFINNTWRTRRENSITVRQVLFDGWDRANDFYRSQARISASSYKVTARAELLGLSVSEAYIDVNRHVDLLNLSKRNVAEHQKLLRLIRQRYDAGAAPISEVEQTLERVEAAISLVSQIRIALDTAKAKYRNAVGNAPGRLRSLRQAPGIPRTLKNAISSAVANNSRLQAAGAEIDIAKFDKKQFSSTLYPQLSIEGSASKGVNLGGTPGLDEEMNAMVVLTWKLFDGGVRMNRTFELAERHSEKIAEQKILARNIVQEIEISWSRMVHGRSQVASLSRQLKQAKKVLLTYRDEYTANKRSLLDLLDAESASFAAQFALSNSKAAQIFAGYQILAQSGILLSKLDIEAPNGMVVLDAPASTNELYFTGNKKLVIPSLR